MFKEIVDDARRTPDIGGSQKLTMSTLCSGELKKLFNQSVGGKKHFLAILNKEALIKPLLIFQEYSENLPNCRKLKIIFVLW